MPDLSNEILQIIRSFHRGKDHAIKLKILASQFGLKDDRKIRATIKELNGKGYPIVTSIEKPFGAYLALSQSELDEYRSNLISRIVSIKERIEDVEGMRIEPVQMKFWGEV